MRVRRVVTGHSTQGKAVVASDTVIERQRAALFPGFEVATVWAADQAAVVPTSERRVSHPTFFPPDGGVRFIHFTLPPPGTPPPDDADLPDARAEIDRVFPGLMASMDPSMPGMHRSDTIDFLYVVSGSVVLRLEDGNTVALAQGDSVVQTGTWHRWENRGSEPCHIVAVLLAARRAP